MMLGPKEPDANQIQEYLSIIVDNLIVLFEDGIRIPTPSCPQGNLITCFLRHESAYFEIRPIGASNITHNYLRSSSNV